MSLRAAKRKQATLTTRVTLALIQLVKEEPIVSATEARQW